MYLLTLLTIAIEVGGVSVSTLSGCAIEYLTNHNIINSTGDDEQGALFLDDCDAKIQLEITKFHDEIQSLIASGVNVENLENSNFINQEECIIGKLKHFNVSNLFLKGIAYEKLNKVHRSEHSFNVRMSSQQILLLYALQVCEPRSFFYARHAEKIFTMNMRTSNAQAHCLLKHLNEDSVDEPYQFGDHSESLGDLQAYKCDDMVRNFIKKYYNVIDRARSFSIFGLNPTKAMQCRMTKDKDLINHMIFLTIFPRLTFTSEQIELEKLRFFDIAKDSAKSFFECISLYD